MRLNYEWLMSKPNEIKLPDFAHYPIICENNSDNSVTSVLLCIRLRTTADETARKTAPAQSPGAGGTVYGLFNSLAGAVTV